MPFRGEIRSAELSETKGLVEIQSSRGLSASGYVIDIATNKPIPDAEIRIFPRQFEQAMFRGSANTATDSTGRFQFEGLESIEYSVQVADACPKGAVVQSVGDGGLSISYPLAVQHLNMTATDPPSEPVRIEVIIHPNSRPRPSDSCKHIVRNIEAIFRDTDSVVECGDLIGQRFNFKSIEY